MSGFAIHPQLRSDCHLLGRLGTTHLLLHRNAAVPWLILVPETACDNLLDLPAAERDAVLAHCKHCADYLRERCGSTRVNLAWIGNLVPQLHIHVVGRRPGDPCWPQPVWGHLAPGAAYGPAELARMAADLIGA